MEQHKIPAMDYRFSVAVKGEESKVLYTGDFLYRRPTLGERARINVMRARLNGDLRTIDPEISYFHEALAHLTHTLKEAPDWWKNSDNGRQLYDGNIIVELYTKVIEFETEWRKKMDLDTPEQLVEGVKDEAVAG